MWWDRSEPVEVYLGRTRLGCKGLDASGTRWCETRDVDDALARLEQWLTESAGRRRARVWLGSTLARPFVLGVDGGARDASEAEALAVSVAGDRTRQDGALKVWLARWRADRPTLAVAIPQTVWDRLSAESKRRRRATARIDSVRPWWNVSLDAALARSRDDASSLGWTLAEPDGLVAGRVQRGEVVEASFEAEKQGDAEWRLLRRRLAIAWQDAAAALHRNFAAEPSGEGGWVIGSAIDANLEGGE